MMLRGLLWLRLVCMRSARGDSTATQVSKLVPDGAAAESRVEVGDLLEAVDGVDVRTWSLKKVAGALSVCYLRAVCDKPR